MKWLARLIFNLEVEGLRPDLKGTFRLREKVPTFDCSRKTKKRERQSPLEGHLIDDE